MDFKNCPEDTMGSNFQPLDKLRWEHALFLREIDKLIEFARHRSLDLESMGTKTSNIIRSIEHHQEAEERFLFPLVMGVGNDVLMKLREEHRIFLGDSDLLVPLIRSETTEPLHKFLGGFRDDLSRHFETEEAHVFTDLNHLLSPAQMDILRIKFASRKAIEI